MTEQERKALTKQLIATKDPVEKAKLAKELEKKLAQSLFEKFGVYPGA